MAQTLARFRFETVIRLVTSAPFRHFLIASLVFWEVETESVRFRRTELLQFARVSDED